MPSENNAEIGLSFHLEAEGDGSEQKTGTPKPHTKENSSPKLPSAASRKEDADEDTKLAEAKAKSKAEEKDVRDAKNEEDDEGEEDEAEEGKNGKKEKGYTCNVCFEIFLSCGRLLGHKRKTGHGSIKCTSCLIFLPSISARKKHAIKTGHTNFEGNLIKVKNCRGVKEGLKKKGEKNQQNVLVEESTDHFINITKVKKHQSEYVSTVEKSLDILQFSPNIIDEEEEDNKNMEQEKLLAINVRANIPEPTRPVFSFVPLNPYQQYNPMDPFWTPPPPPSVVVEEEKKVVVVETRKSPVAAVAVEVRKPVKKEPAVLTKKALRSIRKERGGTEYTPFGKATGDTESDKPFDLQFAFSYEAAMEHNLQLPELLVEDEVEDFPPPSDWMLGRMKQEWSGPSNLEQWEYVHAAVPVEADERELAEGDNRDVGNETLTLQDFERKEQAIAAGLNRAEVVALRLYTGPGYKAINASTRTGDQIFCVTCFALESAIIKVAKVTKKANVVRGLSGKMSDSFQALYAEGRPLKAGEVIADPGFLSTTRNLEVATTGNYKGSTLFLITGKSVRPGLLRMGADVSWISQFPLEQEVLFPQYTELWYATKDKRDPKLDQKFGHLKKTQVYQFGARAKFNEEHSCPNIPGLTK